MEVIELTKYCDNWKLAQINPVKKELSRFLNERSGQIKKVYSSKGSSMVQLEKANKEEKFISAIVDLETVYDEFMKSITRVIHKSLHQYAVGINDGGKLMEQNDFLRERLAIMDKRELTYLELLSKKR